MPAEFLDAHVERYARTQRRLFEDHCQCFALQRLGVCAGIGFYLTRNMQQMPDLLRREVADRKEILRRHAYLPASVNAGLRVCTNSSSMWVILGLPIS